MSLTLEQFDNAGVGEVSSMLAEIRATIVERDEARANLATRDEYLTGIIAGLDCDDGCGCGKRHCVLDGEAECVTCRLTRERDEARAEVERLRAELAAVHAEANREAMHAIAHAARLKAELPKQWQLGSIALAEEPEREELARLRVEVERLREENARLVGEVGNCDDCGKPAGIRACLGCYEKRALKAEAELALWAEKDGNSPGYNLEKARTYGRLAAEARAERDEARAALASVNFWLDEFAAPQGASPEAIAQASKTQGDVLRARLSEARAEVERLKAGIEAGLEEQSLNWHRFTALGETKHRAALEALRERCARHAEVAIDEAARAMGAAIRAVPLDAP